MPIPTTFLDACRAAVLADPAYAAFVAAGAIPAAATRADRDAQWGALYLPPGASPAHRLRLAVRGIVNAEADKVGAGTGTVVTPAERESCYSTLVGEYAPAVYRPASAADELAALNTAMALEQT